MQILMIYGQWKLTGETNFACASSKLWSVMVMICCRMSPMSCFRPSPSAPSSPCEGGKAIPPCTEWPARVTPPSDCMIRVWSSIVWHKTMNTLLYSNAKKPSLTVVFSHKNKKLQTSNGWNDSPGILFLQRKSRFKKQKRIQSQFCIAS